MNDSKKSPFCELEENFMLIPLAVAVVLSLAAMIANFGGEAAAQTAEYLNTLSYYAYTWVCCVGLGSCVKKNTHLKVDIFGGMYSERTKKVFGVLNQILGFVVMAVLFVGSFLILRNALAAGATNEDFPTLPLAVVYFAPVVGYGLGVIRSIQNFMKRGK